MESTSTDSPPSSPTREIGKNSDIVRDVILWKRKNLSVATLLAATSIWLALQIYGLNFITLVSWISIFVIAFLFFWGNVHRLLGKEPVDMSTMHISEETATEMGIKLREWIEKSLRLLFSISAEREWFVFAGTVASLGLLSVVASYFDLLTLLYVGVVVCMSGPLVYVKYEDKIKEYGQRVRVWYQKCYSMVVQKVQVMKNKMQEMKNKLQEKKRKKME